jgi:hypothetical protein
MTYVYKGMVKRHCVVLDPTVSLPEGAEVEVRMVCPPVMATPKRSRKELFARVLEARKANTGLYVGVDELLEEEKQDREERFDHWLAPKP